MTVLCKDFSKDYRSISWGILFTNANFWTSLSGIPIWQVSIRILVSGFSKVLKIILMHVKNVVFIQMH